MHVKQKENLTHSPAEREREVSVLECEEADGTEGLSSNEWTDVCGGKRYQQNQEHARGSAFRMTY
jgi:hypothetical protein